MILATITALALSQATFPTTTKTNESPRNMVTEIKLGSYYPWVDRTLTCGNAGGSEAVCPYRSALGGAMLLVEAEVERQLFQAFGSAAIGVSVGYAEKYGHAKAQDGTETGESTSLRVLPMRLLAAYRFDVPAIRWGIPLVPYVKGGFQVVHWWTTSATGTEIADNIPGGGWSYGLVATAGLAFKLDVLDPRLARDFDTGMGVNHTYFFAEYNIAEVNNFGMKQQDQKTLVALDLSARYFMFGLAFEY